MQGKSRRWWPVAKALVSLAILYFIGRSFARDLAKPELWEQPIHFGWLLPAGLLYLAGLSACALYWRRLLQRLGQRPPLAGTMRAYFIGQLGKYVPGKALALVMRAALLRRAGVSGGLAGMTAFYEVLVTMSAGAVSALVLLVILGIAVPGVPDREAWIQFWNSLREGELSEQGLGAKMLFAVALGLSLLLLGPILPPVFNRLAARLSLPFRDPGAPPPPMRLAYLLEGLLMTATTWPCFGVALALALHAVPGAGLPWDGRTLAFLTGATALAYVAGFAVLIAPGALGVREAFLSVLLTPELLARHDLTPSVARGKVLLAVLLLRLAWTTAELLPPIGFWILDFGFWNERPGDPAAPDLLRSG